MFKFLFVLLLCYMQAAFTRGQNSCYSKPIECVRTMRQLLVNSSHYWFGNSNNTTRQQGPTSIASDNPDPDRFSIASRIFGINNDTGRTNLTSLVRHIKLAIVTYSSPNGIITACGHEFKIPQVSNHMIDPLRTTSLSSWSLLSIPSVAWDSANNQTLYTVVIWDVGHYSLHGLYINCLQSSLNSGEAILNYTNPSNPFFVSNPFIVLVTPQAMLLNHTTVIDAVENNKRRNQGKFSLSEFRNNFDKELSQKPSHINIISLEADPLSIQSYKDRSIVDNCPLLISRLNPLHKMAELSNVSLHWGNVQSEFDDMTNTYLTSLNLNMDVVYETNDFHTDYCCTNYSITSGKFSVSPFNSDPIRSAMVRLKPKISISPVNMKDTTTYRMNTYTLFMIDVAPAVDEGVLNPTYFTHWLITNIRNGEINSGNELCEYFGPNPIIHNSSRTYMFLLFRQPLTYLNNSVIDQFCPNGRWICQISLYPVLHAWNLTDLVAVTWFRAQNDGFAKMRTYTVLKMSSMGEVCVNVTGYPGTCSVTRPSGQRSNTVTSTTNSKNNVSNYRVANNTSSHNVSDDCSRLHNSILVFIITSLLPLMFTFQT